MAINVTAQQEQSQPKVRFERFSAAQRFEHFALIVAFFGLVVTGLPQKYAAEKWGQVIIGFWGGIESTRILHRFFALLLMAEAIYHVGAIVYRLFVLRTGATLLPKLRDFKDLRDWVMHNLGLKRELPAMPRYNFINKLDYWLTVIGTLVLIVTGYMLWNPIATTKALPGETVPVARVVHGEQAVLMVLLVVLWHGYNTLVRRFNRSMLTGRISRAAMREDHGAELARLESGESSSTPSPSAIAQRSRIFWPVAVIAAVALIAIIYSFVTFEHTAIATVPRPEVAIFAPQVQPSEGDANVGAALWQTVRCALCHGPEAGGGTKGEPALRGTKVTFEEFYRQVRNGSDKMPAFRSEELPDAYVLHLYTWLTTPVK